MERVHREGSSNSPGRESDGQGKLFVGYRVQWLNISCWCFRLVRELQHATQEIRQHLVTGVCLNACQRLMCAAHWKAKHLLVSTAYGRLDGDVNMVNLTRKRLRETDMVSFLGAF